ncbi:endonuclease/exonuclease/phosphatase family protein [Endozoicomonas lisbonensis]|uniref:endonuclease/exonuclease/phosphatase family protein n=1 Tax=Endozoicomonas lisbonensis TaxID=3120522 RepID=UPI00339126CB
MKRTVLSLCILTALAGCESETVYIEAPAETPPADGDFDYEYASGEVAHATLIAALDFDKEAYGEKINPQNVGRKFPASIEFNQDQLVWESSGEVLNLKNYERLTFNSLNLAEKRTISFRVYFNEEQSGQLSSIMDGEHWGVRSREPFVVLNADDQIEVWRKYEGSAWEGDDEPRHILTTEKIERGKWFTFTFAGDDQETRIYFDGNLVGQGPAIAAATNKLAFGAALLSRSHQDLIPSARMKVDDIKIFRGPLPVDYIRSLTNPDPEERPLLPPGSPVPTDTIKNVDYEQVVLTWQHNNLFKTRDVEYTVFLSTDSKMNSVDIEWRTLNTHFTAGALKPDTDYFWRIDSYDGSTRVRGPVWSFRTSNPVDKSLLPEQLNVMAYNIWHAGADADPLMGQDYLFEQIQSNNIDILLMVESYGYQQALANKLGFYMHTGGSNDNLSILSRYPIIQPLGTCSFGFCGARIELPENRQLDAYAIWLSSINDGAMIPAIPSYTNDDLVQLDTPRANTMESYLETIETLSDSQKRPIIMGGDLNTSSHLDYTDETNYYNRGQVNWPTSLVIEQFGYTDTLRQVYPFALDMECITWSPFFKNNYGRSRIDMVFNKGAQLNSVDAGCLLDNSHPVLHPADHGAAWTTLKVDKALWDESLSLIDDFDRDRKASESFSFMRIEGDKLWSDEGFNDGGADGITEILEGGILRMTNSSSGDQNALMAGGLPSEDNGWTMEFRVQVTDPGSSTAVWQAITRSSTYDQRIFIGANGIGESANNGSSIKYPVNFASDFRVVRIAYDPLIKAARLWVDGDIVAKNIESNDGYFNMLGFGNSSSNISSGQILIDYVRIEDGYHAPTTN